MIIYILGKAHSGKSEAARYFRRKHRFIEVSLADPMKRFLKDLYGFTDQQLWGSSQMRNMPDPRFPRSFELEKYGAVAVKPTTDVECLSPREALQTLGEAMRGCYSDTWVRRLFETVEELERGGVGYAPPIGLFGDGHPVLGINPEHRLGPYSNFVVPDVRHHNEHQALKRVGAKGFRIVSPTQGEGLEGKLAEHRSEVEQREIPDGQLDAVIRNDGSLEDLHTKLDAFLETYN